MWKTTSKWFGGTAISAASKSIRPHAPIQVAVLGGGSFGTALVRLLGELGNRVSWWIRDPGLVRSIQTEGYNTKHLSRYKIVGEVHPDTDIGRVLASSSLVFLVVPASAVESVLREMLPHLHSEHYLVTTMKGVREEAPLLYSEYIQKELSAKGLNIPLGILGGPNLAEEIAQSRITGSVIASKHAELSACVAKALSCRTFQIEVSEDNVGVELGGALKNIYAVAAGLLDALSEGENCKGMFISDGFLECIRFAKAFGAQERTLYGMSGIGDLVATSYSVLSRNHRLGLAIGSGLPYREAEKIVGGVAEGYPSLLRVKKYADLKHIEMPLLNALYRVIEEEKNASEFLDLWLQSRSLSWTEGEIKA